MLQWVRTWMQCYECGFLVLTKKLQRRTAFMPLESLIMVTAWPKVFDRRLSTTIGFGRVCFGLVRAGDEAESHRFGPNTVVMLVGGKRVHLNFIANVVAIHSNMR